MQLTGSFIHLYHKFFGIQTKQKVSDECVWGKRVECSLNENQTARISEADDRGNKRKSRTSLVTASQIQLASVMRPEQVDVSLLSLDECLKSYDYIDMSFCRNMSRKTL